MITLVKCAWVMSKIKKSLVKKNGPFIKVKIKSISIFYFATATVGKLMVFKVYNWLYLYILLKH